MDAVTDNSLDFTGKIVLVTGGATGIGRAASLAFARQGATVVIGDIDERSNDTVKLIEKEGGRGLFVPTDVTLARDVDRLVSATVDTFGDLHIAFNNAGVFVPPAPSPSSPRRTGTRRSPSTSRASSSPLSTRSPT
ncbi:SDR family oxidoreductase [Streptomyces sp. FXJ1.4098]|nr:SDR family oxidoreductase [Streptomyces sp. FXJ1.4098]